MLNTKAKHFCLAFFCHFMLTISRGEAAPVVDNWKVIHSAFFNAQKIGLATEEILITAPEQAEDAAIVPVTFAVSLPQSTIKRMDVFTDANPILLTATFIPQQLTHFFEVSTRIRLESNSLLRVVVEGQDGVKLMKTIPIKTPGGGCGGGLNQDEAKLRSEAGKMKLKVHMQEKSIALNIKHPMRTGFERTTQGYYAKAWYIQTVLWSMNAEPLLKAELGPGISADPFFKFSLDSTWPATKSYEFSIEAHDNEGKIFQENVQSTVAVE